MISSAVDAPTSTAEPVLDAIDAVARESVLVFGSLPPQGRDIDLLVSGADEAAIAARLLEDGFERFKGRWALFRDCTACVVELVDGAEWRLPPQELEALFSEATPLAGYQRVSEPSPHHTLLILARKLGRHPGLAARHRARIDRALAASPVAWELAEERAPAWKLEAALRELRSVYEGRSRPRRPGLRVPGRTRIVALSGVDGAGKSSQARFLQEALNRLGYDAVVEWSPAHAISLNLLARPIRRLLGYGSLSTLPDRVNPDFRPSDYPAVVVHPWVTIAALSTALSLWRSVLRHFGRGRVVICDRYSLDFATFFSYRHGGGRNFRVQTWLLRALAPSPAAAFFLDIAPEVALARKEDQYSLPELRRQADVYRSLSSAFRVRTLDGEQSVDALCREIQREAWRRLEGFENSDATP